MLASLARFDIRYRWVVAAAWIVGAIAAARLLPGLSSVSQATNAQFLPANAPSQQAAALADPFHTGNAAATALIVVARSNAPLDAADEAAITQLEAAVQQVPGVTAVRDQGRSPDGQARRALVITNARSGNTGDPALVDAIRNAFYTVPAPSALTVHLTGPLALATDASASASQTGTRIRVFLVLFVVVLLFAVYRSLLAPMVTLIPPVLSLLLAGPVIAQASQVGLPVSVATQTLLPVLLIGAGTDYGLFLVYRLREELRRGRSPSDALVTALERVGASITFSGMTVIAALACLLLASFTLYRGLGPSLAIGIAVMLLAALTLLPALLAIFGRAVFWPSHPAAGQTISGVWGRVAARVVRRPLPVLLVGVILFAGLGAGLANFATGGFSSTPPPGTDSAAGTDVLAAHFPVAASSPDTLLLRFDGVVWTHLDGVATAERELEQAPNLRAVAGPLNPNGTPLSIEQLAALHASAGPAASRFISADGRTVQFEVSTAAGSAGTPVAIDAIPSVRSTLDQVAHDVGAQAAGVAGVDSVAADINHYSASDLLAIAPVVLAVLALLLAVVLRSLVAPIYLILTVGLSYVAALGTASFLFIRLVGDAGLNFVIPILLFIFAMALGEDYNILLMTRVREENRERPLGEALIESVGRTGGTITSAGLILAGTFAVLAVAGNSDQSRQLGFTIAFAVLLDTFFVRTLLVPSIAMLLGRWNWWPSRAAPERQAQAIQAVR